MLKAKSSKLNWLRGQESNHGLGDYEPPVQPYTTPYISITLSIPRIIEKRAVPTVCMEAQLASK